MGCSKTFSSVLQALKGDEFCIATLSSKQFVVSALLNNASLVEDVDEVRLLNGREPMSDRDGGSALCGGI
jgi:hypothetical protein